MLILTRRIGETIVIGDNVSMTVLNVRGNQVRLGISAPKDVAVHREEIYQRIRNEGAEGAGAEGSEESTDTPRTPTRKPRKDIREQPGDYRARHTRGNGARTRRGGTPAGARHRSRTPYQGDPQRHPQNDPYLPRDSAHSPVEGGEATESNFDDSYGNRIEDAPWPKNENLD